MYDNRKWSRVSNNNTMPCGCYSERQPNENREVKCKVDVTVSYRLKSSETSADVISGRYPVSRHLTSNLVCKVKYRVRVMVV